MALWNLGSISDYIQGMIEDIPSVLIGGGRLLILINNQRLFAEQFTGQSIGSVNIEEKYQPALIDLSIAEVLRHMEIFGADVNNIKLGDFSVSKGQGSNLTVSSEAFRAEGIRKLAAFGRKTKFYKALG